MATPHPTSPELDRPRNLAAELRPALERLGFVVQVLESSTQTLLMATWFYAENSSYQVLYTYRPVTSDRPLSYASIRRVGRLGGEDLVSDTHVRKVAELRLLLMNNVRYKAARLAALAAGTLQPADQQPAN